MSNTICILFSKPNAFSALTSLVALQILSIESDNILNIVWTIFLSCLTLKLKQGCHLQQMLGKLPQKCALAQPYKN